MVKGEDAAADGRPAGPGSSDGSSYDKLSWCDSWMKRERGEIGKARSLETDPAKVSGTARSANKLRARSQ